MNGRFGDAEPEDAYDAGDPPAVQLANVIRRVELALADLVTIRTRIAGDDED